MKIQDIINHLQERSPWVDFSKTRDIVYCGDTGNDTDKVGVCWVATRRVLEEAARKGITFIITHENFLYQESTSPYLPLLESRRWKLDFCRQNGITVYRCHDIWDRFPQYGISDTFASIIDLPFEERDVRSFYHYANVQMSARQVAQKLADALMPYSCENVELLGNPEAAVHRVGIGTGAITSFEEMHRNGCDCIIVTDDGSNNWIDFQFCLDNGISLIICHHSSSEIPGMDQLDDYLRQQFPQVEFFRLYEGYRFTCIKGNPQK